MPTGVALRDVREQLFAAAERVLLRDGPHALTSRAVTAEAGCAKGVLHKHFADFDAFLAELVLDRIAQLEGTAAGLLDRAGVLPDPPPDTVTGNARDPAFVILTSIVLVSPGLRLSASGGTDTPSTRFPSVVGGSAANAAPADETTKTARAAAAITRSGRLALSFRT